MKAQQTRMAQKTASKFEITGQVIDFGDRVVAVRHVTFAARRQGHPFRVPGAVLLVAALAGMGYEAVLGGGLSTLATGGSTRLWLALVLAGIAVFALVYQQRSLVIGLDDGSKIALPASADDFMERVLGCIGGALETDGAAPFHVAVDMRAQTIESLRHASPAGPGGELHQPMSPVQNGSHVRIETPDQMETGAVAQARRHAPASAANALSPTRNGHDPAALNGTGNVRNGTERTIPQYHGQQPHQTSAAGWVAPASTNPASYTGPAPINDPAARQPAQQAELRPLREPSNPLRDMDMLLDFVRRSDVQHKAALLELLAVAEDYLKGGPTLREDASAHWQSFSGYVQQYLTSVDGLVALTERAGRPFAAH